MLTLGGIGSPGRCVSLLPAQLHIWLSGKACALEAMPGDPTTLIRSIEAGRLKRLQETLRTASPQALCFVILQLLASGSWTQVTEKFVVITAPNMYLHRAHLRAQNSEGSTLSATSSGA